MIPHCPLAAARRAALLEVYPYLRERAARAARGPDAEDLAHDVAVSFLCEYDPARGAPTTFVAVCLRHLATTRHLRGIAAAARHVRCARPEAVPPADAAVAAADELGHLRRGLSALDAPTRQLIAARFGLGGGGPKTLDQLDPAVTREGNRLRLVTALRRARLLLAARSG